MKKNNFHFVRQINEISVLRIIRDRGPISRSEVARVMGLSKVIIGGIVARLIETEIIFEIGKGDSTDRGGRRPIMLEFNANAWYAIGVEIHLNYASILITNMNAETVAQRSISYKDNTNPDNILRRIVKAIEKLFDDESKMDRILGLGVALPGLVDYQKGSLRYADSLKSWVGFPIKTHLEGILDTRVYVENDVKTTTLGEFHWGAGIETNNLVYIWLGEGIGAGLVINGELYRGFSSSAGEIGYNEIGGSEFNAKNFPILYAHQIRYGEILNNRYLVSALQRHLETNHVSSKLQGKKLDLALISEVALEGDALAAAALSEFGTLLGMLLISMVNFLNPEMVVLGGPVMDSCGIVLEKAIARAREDALMMPAQEVQILAGSLKNRAGVLGAVGLVLQDLFKPPIVNLNAYRSLFSVEN
ncbi:MAG TPA: hypothetical protein DHU63_11760 [Candidatus Marinimicrobia bacterium]|nr:MAG: hypothetical protein AUJ47_07775 [Candidatus Marinimicrobia bacterium CG1_02_48_14]PIZ69446.1 MAG: hypothetical protein COY19_01865 [Candidatus Marinimicrobia bacterium CG_4_10_14_0_2_um_filter_48_9]PJA54972.1 MAG: hypothetical protein CO167_00785 [Candidatus Marinimicrobia bacterium CG_4_9_14_3_um_filter_48_9]HCW77197.1 hypothetical protein [Candidatus Neomarinimicrobiota bacterium]